MKLDRHDGTREPGALVDAEEFARRRGVSPEQVDELMAQHRLFSLERDGKTLYPAFLPNRQPTSDG
ncbi:MAG: hypothetical protein JNL87_17950 [Burkholderiaceae bacterium]|nr:hypothetical protein [Burkholderiaceae bacterium]